MKKLNRLLRRLEKKYDYGMINDEQVIAITETYFSLYQIDTIVRDLANINRLTEYGFDYNDYEKDDFNYLNVSDENKIFEIVKNIIFEKINNRDF